MEEKKVTKVSLSTFLLLIAIVAIFVMGFYIYKLNDEKSVEVQKSSELQAQVDSLNAKILSIPQSNQDIQDNVSDTLNELNNSEEIQENENISSKNNDVTLSDEELFYCENVSTNSDGTYTFKGVIYEPYRISTNDFKEMIKQDTIVLNENNLSNRLIDNKCIIKKLDENELFQYELFSSDNSEHFCYIEGNDEEGYELTLGTEYSTIWKKTNNTKEVIFPKDSFYLDIENLGYANAMSKEELEEKIGTIFDYDSNKFKELEGKYLKFGKNIYTITEGVTSFH